MNSIDGTGRHEPERAQQYRYTPLQSNGGTKAKSIRLLVIHPARFNDDICLDLYESTIDTKNTPQYEALSYVWGPKEDPVTVYMGKEQSTFGVTPYLYKALKHLRYEDKSRIIWIDAICINQTDNAERSAQVAIMGDIYRQAKQVVVWLGSEENQSSHALSLLDSLGEKVRVDWDTGAITPSSNDAGDKHWADKYASLPYDKKDLESLTNLFQRQWFERLWIRQEIILSRDAVVQCGLQIIPWKRFRRALFVIAGKDFSSVRPGSELSNWITVIRPRLRLLYQVCTTKSTTFGDLRYNFGLSRCQDPRDRIYGVLSILDEREQSLGIVPDYSKETQVIYRDVVVRYIKSLRELNILLQCEPVAPFDSLTWVPDWSVPSVNKPPLAWTAAASSQLMAHVEIRGETFCIAGKIIDKIKNVINFESKKLEGPLDVLEALRTIIPATADETPYPTGDTLLEAYVRTMVRDYLKDILILPNVVLNVPTRAKAVECVRAILSAEPTTLQEMLQDPVVSFISGFAAESLSRYSFFITEKGYIGLGRLGQIQAGDNVCALLGCDYPMVIRPCGTGQNHLIGESFVHGFMYGEAFLGPLPPQFCLSPMQHTSPAGSKLLRAYLDRETDVRQPEDPRLAHRFPIDLSLPRRDWEKGIEALVDVPPNILEAGGVDISWIALK
ncbi:heterokaryon incompatibility protein domain-containing protein [Trichoderma velutinum]